MGFWCQYVANYENNSDFYMFSEEQQQVEETIIGGIYILAVIITCGVWLFTIFVDTVVVIPMTAFLIYLYFVYRAITTDSFRKVYDFLSKHYKYKKIHHYFEQSKNHKQKGSIIDWDIKMKTRESYQPEKVFQKIELRDNAAGANKKLFFYRKINQQVENKHLPTRARYFQRQVTTQQYLKVRYAYKNTVIMLSGNGIQQKQLQYLSGILKDKYTLKIKQLLKKSEENIRTIKNIIEENFEVKIVENKDTPEKLEPVHIDQAIKVISQQGQFRCLPWTPRMKKEDDTRQVIDRLVELVDTQQKFDQVLCDQFQISQKYREKMANKILFQLQEKKNGKQLLKVILEIYNQEKNHKFYKIGWKLMNIKGGLSVVESEMGEYLHADLQVTRWGVDKIYNAKPGEDNFWSLLGMATMIERLKW